MPIALVFFYFDNLINDLEEKGKVNQQIKNSSSYILFIILYKMSFKNIFKFSTNKHWY